MFFIYLGLFSVSSFLAFSLSIRLIIPYSLLASTADPRSHVSILMGHRSHAGNLCQRFLASEVFCLVGGSRSEVDIKIHNGALYILRQVGSRERRRDATGRQAQTTSPRRKRGQCLLSRLTWACWRRSHREADLLCRRCRTRHCISQPLSSPESWAQY